MTPRTVVIVPATVPAAQVTRVLPSTAASAPVTAAAAEPVSAPSVRPLLPDQLSAEQVAELREENRLLRKELARVQQRG